MKGPPDDPEPVVMRFGLCAQHPHTVEYAQSSWYTVIIILLADQYLLLPRKRISPQGY